MVLDSKGAIKMVLIGLVAFITIGLIVLIFFLDIGSSDDYTEEAIKIINAAHNYKSIEELRQNIEEIKPLVSESLFRERFDIDNDNVFMAYFSHLDGFFQQVEIVDLISQYDKKRDLSKVGVFIIKSYQFEGVGVEVLHTSVLMKFKNGKLVDYLEFTS